MPKRKILGNSAAYAGPCGPNNHYASPFVSTFNAVVVEARWLSNAVGHVKGSIYRGVTWATAQRLAMDTSGVATVVGTNIAALPPIHILYGDTIWIAGNNDAYNATTLVIGGVLMGKALAYATNPSDPPGAGYTPNAYTIRAELWGWIPSSIISIGTDDDILDNETAVPVVGLDFTDGEGTLKIWLCSTSDFATAPIKVEQDVTPGNDTGATFNVVPTDLSPGTVYAFAETIIGGISQVSAAHPITLTAHVIRADSYKARKHAHHAEIKLGCIIADNFRSQSSSEENGATITGGATFDRFRGMATDGTGRAEFLPWGLTDGSIVVAFKADSEGPIAATAPLHDGLPVDGWCIWVDAEGVHATHSDGASLATECLAEGDFIDGEEHVLTYAVDLTGGFHALYVDGESDDQSTSITGPLSEEDGIIVGGFDSDGIVGEIGGFRMFNGSILTEADHNAYAS